MEDYRVHLPLGEPKFMAADDHGLYLCYVEYGPYAYDKVALTEIDWFETFLGILLPPFIGTLGTFSPIMSCSFLWSGKDKRQFSHSGIIL